MAGTVVALAGVTPTIAAVRGFPIPGLSGVTPRALPAHGSASFASLLRDVTPAPGAPPTAPAAAPPGTSLAGAIRRAAGSAGVDPALSVAVARAESNLDPRARSTDGRSVGTFQMTRATANEMRRKIASGVVARPSGTDDVALGVGYLRYLDGVFSRSARLARGLRTVAVPDAGERRLFAVAAFNAGEGRVARAQAQAAAAGADPRRFEDVKRFLPTITRAYVPRVIALARTSATA
jgi:soluble lytic murein transglycosylase-like protein